MSKEFRMADVLATPVRLGKGCDDGLILTAMGGRMTRSQAYCAAVAINSYNEMQDKIDQQAARIAELEACLKYYKYECTGYEPSISVFQRDVDRLLGSD